MVGGRLVSGLVLAMVVLSLACSSTTEPQVAATVRVETARFFPDQVEVSPGAQVRWYNFLAQGAGTDRTVTSGTGPGDENAGDLFDEVLGGYAQGQPEGDSFIYEFNEPGEYKYFSRLPGGAEFFGTVVVR